MVGGTCSAHGMPVCVGGWAYPPCGCVCVVAARCSREELNRFRAPALRCGQRPHNHGPARGFQLHSTEYTQGNPVTRMRRGTRFAVHNRGLLDDLEDDTRADRLVAFTDGEPLAFFDDQLCDEFNPKRGVFTRHHHFAVVERNGARDVARAREQLRAVSVDKRRVATAFLLAEHIHLRLKLGVLADTARLGHHHPFHDVISLESTDKATHVVSCFATVQALLEHFNPSDGRIQDFAVSDQFYFVSFVHHTTLNSARHDRSASGNGVRVFNRHEKVLVQVAHGFGDPFIAVLQQLTNSFLANFGSSVLQRAEGGTRHKRCLIAVKSILRKQITNFHFNQFQKFRIVYHVRLVDEYTHALNTNLAGEKQVFPSLWHLSIVPTNDQDGTIHLGRTRDHVLHIISVTWAVYMGVVAVVRLVLDVGCGDRNTAGPFFRCVINLVVVLEVGSATL
eukprot:m.118843 g.118843  ORF g.118843 m.118843 type:complete len:449 (+) comp17225_c0_seq1:44-1390(+)